MSTDSDARFAALLQERWVPLLRTAVLLTGDRHAGEDLLQSALLRSYAAAARGADPDSLEAYVRTTMLRLAGRWWYRRSRADVPTAELPDVAADLPDADRPAEVRAALAALPLGQRAVLVLRYLEGRSESETAALLGVSPGTVKSRSSRGLAALRAGGLLADHPHVPTGGGA